MRRGVGLPGVPDPFQGGRFSGLLPERTGVEVIGGPYLHASLKTNFTQFGEGKLFGRIRLGSPLFCSVRQTLPSISYIMLESRMRVGFVRKSRPGEGAR